MRPLEEASKEIKEYRKFMCNPENCFNCSKCPENRDMASDFDRRYPCGQQNCWVDVTCNR